MMPNTPSSAEVADLFAAILRREGIDAPIIALDIEGFRDDPGFHWSNPGLKLATITAGGLQHPFVVKRLGHRSRREVPIYCTLSAQSDFPMPRL